MRALADTHLRIYLVVDIWSSLNIYVIFGVKCRFINQRYQVQNILFGLSKIPKAHSGIKFAKLLFEVLETYRCMDHISFLVSNNASTLDTIINNLEEWLINVDVDWPAAFHRI